MIFYPAVSTNIMLRIDRRDGTATCASTRCSSVHDVIRSALGSLVQCANPWARAGSRSWLWVRQLAATILMLVGESRSKKKAWFQAYKLLFLHYVSLSQHFTFSLHLSFHCCLTLFAYLLHSHHGTCQENPQKQCLSTGAHDPKGVKADSWRLAVSPVFSPTCAVGSVFWRSCQVGSVFSRRSWWRSEGAP